MTELLSADIILREQAPATSTPPSLPTAVLGLVGVAKKGPFGKKLITSWDEYVRYFGSWDSNSDMGFAAYGYFQNGGRQLYISRIVHYTDPNDSATKTSAASTISLTTTGAATQGSVTTGNTEPFELFAGGDLDLKVDGGGTETATFDAAAGARTGSGGTYSTGFVGGETLLPKIDGGTVQTITFTSGAQTLAQVIDEINPQLVGGYADEVGGELRITSDKLGTGSGVEVTGGTGAATLGMGVGATAGTGDVADISAVSAAEAKALIEADTTAQVTVEGTGAITIKTPTIGAGGSIQVEASSTLDDAGYFDLDNSVHSGSAAGAGDTATVDAKYDGADGDNLKIRIAAATSGDSDEFNWTTLYNDIVQEFWANLSTDPNATNYWETVLNHVTTGSELITLTDLLAGSPPANRPDNGDYSLTGGDNGLSGLVDADFIGSSAGGTGIYAFDEVEDLTLLAVPGRSTAGVHQAMLTYTETWRSGQVFAILDSVLGHTATQCRDYVRTTAAIYNLSEHGAFYWPRMKMLNPNETVYTSDENGLVTVPPSGHIAGVFARTDQLQGGIHQAPAGPVRGIIFGCLGFETDEVLRKEKRDIVYPANINPLTTWAGVPRHIDGNRCLKTDGLFGTIGERRGMSYIERSIKILLSYARHTNNTKSLRRRATRDCETFLTSEMKDGAFASDDPSTAFFVDFGDDLNPPSVVNAKKLRGNIGVAKAKPTDWVIIDISEDTRALDEELAG
jgi:hypothetical protein